MRIDEFSAAAQIDGTISTTEQAQFLLVGFDIEIAEAQAPELISLSNFSVEDYMAQTLSVAEHMQQSLSVSEHISQVVEVT